MSFKFDIDFQSDKTCHTLREKTGTLGATFPLVKTTLRKTCVGPACGRTVRSLALVTSAFFSMSFRGIGTKTLAMLYSQVNRRHESNFCLSIIYLSISLFTTSVPGIISATPLPTSTVCQGMEEHSIIELYSGNMYFG
jgi:hypothetical protein